MADIRIKDLPTTATQTASDDFIALDGTVNGTRKIDASAPSFKTSVTSPSIVAPAATALTLTGGSTGASLVLGATTSGIATITTGTPTTGRLNVGAANIFVTGGSAGLWLNASGAFDVGAYETSGALRFRTGTADKMSLTSTGNLLIGTTTDMTGSGGLKIAGTTAATNTTSGALQVGSNIGLSGNAGGPSYFGGTVNITSTGAQQGLSVSNTVANIPAIYLRQSNSASGDFTILNKNGSAGYTALSADGGADVFQIYPTTGNIKLTSTTPSTTTTSGALIVAGGVGVSGSIYAGSTILANGNATATNGVTTTGTLAQLYFAADTSGANVYGALLATNTEAQLKTNSNHALKLGTNNTTRITIAAGGDVSLASTTASTGVGTGSLQVAGGIYTAKQSWFEDTSSGANVATFYTNNNTGIATGHVYINSNQVAAPFDSLRVRQAGTGNILSLVGTAAAGTVMTVASSGAATFAGAVTIAGTVIHTLSATPASASATGTVGTMSWDANYIYICTAANTWKRVAIATW